MEGSGEGKNSVNVTIPKELQRRLDIAFPEGVNPTEQVRMAAGVGVHRRLAEIGRADLLPVEQLDGDGDG